MPTLNGVEYNPDGVCADCGLPAEETVRWLHPTFLPGDWNQKVTLLCGPCSQKPSNNGIRGLVCRFHFNNRTGSMADVAACVYCQEIQRLDREKTQREDTIDPDQEWGAHIALTCRNHPDLRWSTKNISYIGARSIFFSDHDLSKECDCSARDLVVVK
jgi:hypothetical protein